uniref:Uncharacterized protein n=1 Tax=Anguilla anguilla TaxID=7936 RepID=A0A0E9RVI2_ANGAN
MHDWTQKVATHSHLNCCHPSFILVHFYQPSSKSKAIQKLCLIIE